MTPSIEVRNPDADPVALHSRVTYTRHSDGTDVQGTIVRVRVREREPLIFTQVQLYGEQVAYDLHILLPEDRDRIGHPVTIGASRVRLTAPEEPR